MTRRLLFASLFAGLALSSMGCHGALRNFIHRVRANHGCCVGVGGCCPTGPVYSPSYSVPYGVPVQGAYGDPGCSSCGGSPVPMAAPAYANYGGPVPTVPYPSPMAAPNPVAK